MTTTTADKGELPPLPEPAQWFIDVTTNGRSTGRYEVCAEEYRDSEGVVPLFTAGQMREYALANMSRATTAQATPAGEGVELPVVAWMNPKTLECGDGEVDAQDTGCLNLADHATATAEIAKRDAEIARLVQAVADHVTVRGEYFAELTTLRAQLAGAQKDAVVLLKACRRAVLSLAAAAERMPEFKNDYDAMSAAIDAAIAQEGLMA